jgi:nucleoside-diphosphate-sugar epimerase
LPATPLDQQQVFGSNAKISKDLGWHPTVDLEEGLTRTIAWLKRLPSNYYST